MNVRAKPDTKMVERDLPFECISLVLQGGGALGAYQVGVYETLARLRRPTASTAPIFRKGRNFVRQARGPEEAIRQKGMAACGAKQTFAKPPCC
jgi:hypothetical protein